MWNVRGLIGTEKLLIVEGEAKDHRVELMGLAETHKKGSGHFITRMGNAICFSGNDTNSQNGVAIMVSRR